MKKMLALGLLVLVFTSGCHGVLSVRNGQAAKTTLRVVLWDYDKTSYDRRMIEAFEQNNPDIVVEVISCPDDYYEEKVHTLLESGPQVDVIYSRNATAVQKLYREGQLMDVSARAKTLPLEQYRGIQDLRRVSDDGALYALPYRWDHCVLYYNRDLFDRAGIEYPRDGMTWEEFCALGAALRAQCTAGEYPLMLLPDANQNYWKMRRSNVDFRSGSLAGMQELCELVLRFQQLGLTPPYAQNILRNVGQRLFESGKYGMYLGGTWYMNYLYTDQKQGRFKMDWGAVSCPVWKDEPDALQSPIMSTVSVTKNTRHPEEAWRFLTYISGEEGAGIMAEEMMLPAYRGDSVLAVFRQMSEMYPISSSVYEWDRAAPVQILDQADLHIRDMVYEEYLQAVTGEKTVAQAMADMYDRRARMLGE